MSDLERGGRQRADFGILLLRLGIGAGIMTHGYPKLFGGPGKHPPDAIVKLLGENLAAIFERGGIESLSGALEKMGIPYPRQAALLTGLAEFGGGLTLALGFKTRLAAVPVLIAMLVAIGKAHWKTGFTGQGGYEMAYLYALAAAVLILTGSGKYALDVGGSKQ